MSAIHAADEFGIVWETWRERWRRCHDPRLTPGGLAIFVTREAREEAIQMLRDLGYHHLVTHIDVHGFGLSWAERYGNYSRFSARDRLPSIRRAHRLQHQRDSWWAAELKHHRSSYALD